MAFTLLIILGLATLWLLLQAVSQSRGAPGAAAFWRGDGRPRRISHRGCAARYPENTLHAFTASLADGAEAIELDVHLSADGVPVVIHDPTLERTTNGTGSVREQTVAALAALRAAPPNSGVEEGVPTLEAVFEKFPKTPLLVEVKTVESVPDVIALIDRFDRRDRTLIGSFSGTALKLARKLDARVPTCASRGEVGLFYVLACLRLDHLLRPAYNAFSLPPRSGILSLTAAPLRRAARVRGLPLLYWTINDTPTARRLADLGADGIMSDDPDVLASV
ncbi:MAG: hypothetical protein JJT96_10765 [Opitutales bacterium]|nr:hypothetical protein [Opitutales bacterium]